MSSGLITADAADKWLESRVNMPTELDSSELGAVPQNVRAHAFFSAKVAEARVLERLRDVSDAYSRGEINKAEAVGSLKKYLVSEGYMAGDRRNPPPPGIDPVAWGKAGKLTNLASTSRLNLILEQNASMAYSVRVYDEGMSARAQRRKPYWQYVHAMNGIPNQARAAHQSLNGKIFEKTDPIWHSIFPPNGFNCHCGVRELNADEAQEIGISQPDDIKELPDESVFAFDPADAFKASDLSNLEPLDRKRILDQAAEAVREKDIGKCGVIVAPQTEGLPLHRIEGEDEVRQKFEAMEKTAREELQSVGLDPDNLPDYKEVNRSFSKVNKEPARIPKGIIDSFPDGPTKIANLNKRFADAAGIPEMPIMLDKGNDRIGIAHLWYNHKDLFTDPNKFVKMLHETIGNPNCRCVVSLERIVKSPLTHGKAGPSQAAVVTRIVLHNPVLSRYCVMTMVDDKLFLTSLHAGSDGYGRGQWSMKKK